MSLKSILAGAIFVVALNLPGAAFAGAKDFTFEPVKAEVKKSSAVTLTVRLINKVTGKPVPNAVIFASRVDMDMTKQRMEDMTEKLKTVAGKEPGTYDFKTAISMAGDWVLTLSAKVPGETETVTGKVTFKVTD